VSALACLIMLDMVVQWVYHGSMDKARLTLKIDEETIERLKQNAAAANKSLAEYITDRSIIYEDQLVKGITLQTSFISQKSFEREIYRVDVDASNIKYGRYLLVRRYEIWATSEAIEDALELSNSPSLPELAEFAFSIIKNEFEKSKDSNGDRVLPNVYGYFISNNKGVQEAKNREELWEYLDGITLKT